LKDILIKVVDEASQKFGTEYVEARAQKLSKTMLSALANNERKIGQLVAPWVLVENVKVIGK
jgi:hypothetical protein